MINSAERWGRLNLFTNKETNIFEGQVSSKLAIVLDTTRLYRPHSAELVSS
jgi:hypothetical protein